MGKLWKRRARGGRWIKRLKAFRSCPLTTPKRTRSALQMRAIAQAMAVLCALIGHVLVRCSGTPEKLSASELDFIHLKVQTHGPRLIERWG